MERIGHPWGMSGVRPGADPHGERRTVLKAAGLPDVTSHALGHAAAPTRLARQKAI